MVFDKQPPVRAPPGAAGRHVGRRRVSRCRGKTLGLSHQHTGWMLARLEDLQLDPAGGLLQVDL